MNVRPYKEAINLELFTLDQNNDRYGRAQHLSDLVLYF